MSPEQLAKWAEQAELVRDEYSDYAGNMPQLEAFARLVAEDCTNTSPDGLNVGAELLPHRVWEIFRDAIRAKYGIKP